MTSGSRIASGDTGSKAATVAASRANHDPRDGRVYVSNAAIDLAIEVALATGRPLLLRGEPGSGKSSLAAWIAAQRGWRYYEHVVTSRTLAQHFLWSFDHVRRLADAQAAAYRGTPVNDHDYVTPGVLWWALDRESAGRRGISESGDMPATRATEPFADLNVSRAPDQAVVLIDEIDKADSDTPNGLLVPLGSHEFRVTETDTMVRDRPLARDTSSSHLLIVITTNEERDLPQAFMRRCVVYRLTEPDTQKLVDIAARHLEVYEGLFTESDRELAEALAAELDRIRKRSDDKGARPPSTAEYLDALRACRILGIAVGTERWDQLCGLTLTKGTERRLSLAERTDP